MVVAHLNHADFNVVAPKTVWGGMLSKEISQCLALDRSS
ncbi:hypothetical protein AmDm5_3102 [Acetobacter malorum]|nr:hypothetical protein AmDm5_3102 [Acetobacter malorum]